MSAGALAALGAVLLLVSAASTGAAATPSAPAQVRFLFDLGDGTYSWATVAVPDPIAANASWDATLSAAASVGLYVSWAWSTSYGVYITDLGNRSPPGGVGVYIWNGTSDAWDALSVGISSLVLRDGDAVAITDNGFDPVTYAGLVPVPTPLDPYPVLEFRGDAANSGDSSSTAPSLFALRWDHDLHLTEIPSSPAVGYGLAYVLTLDGLFAMRMSNGAVVWSNTTYHGLSTPAVFNGILLFGGADGRLHAVRAADGTEAWNVSLVEHPLFSGVTSSPKLLWDTVYVGTFNESGGPGNVVALWATNGTVQWTSQAPGSVSFSSPAIVNGTVYVGVIGKYNTTTQVTYDPPYGVLALDAATGAQRWFRQMNGSVAASPLVTGSEVIVPSKDGSVYALNATTGAVLWETAVDAGVSSPALVDGAVVVAGGAYGSGGRVTALDAATGAVRWSFTPNGPVQSSVAAADGKVFFSTNVANGTLYALNATGGRLDWSYTPSPAQYMFGSPVVADGMVVAPSDNGHVYAFGPADVQLPATVNVTAPAALALGQTANVSVRVSAPNGTWDDVRLRVTVTTPVEILSASLAATRVNQTLFADLGPVRFGQSEWFNVTVRGNGTGYSDVVVFGQFTVGLPLYGYSPAVQTILVNLGQTAPPFPWLVYALVGVVAVVAVVAVVTLVLRRKPRAP